MSGSSVSGHSFSKQINNKLYTCKAGGNQVVSIWRAKQSHGGEIVLGAEQQAGAGKKSSCQFCGYSGDIWGNQRLGTGKVQVIVVSQHLMTCPAAGKRVGRQPVCDRPVTVQSGSKTF